MNAIDIFTILGVVFFLEFVGKLVIGRCIIECRV